jgi:hypothetical protein
VAREEDAELEVLDDDDGQPLGDGELVAMAVKEAPLIWRTYPGGRVALSEECGAERGVQRQARSAQ